MANNEYKFNTTTETREYKIPDDDLDLEVGDYIYMYGRKSDKLSPPMKLVITYVDDTRYYYELPQGGLPDNLHGNCPKHRIGEIADKYDSSFMFNARKWAQKVIED